MGRKYKHPGLRPGGLNKFSREKGCVIKNVHEINVRCDEKKRTWSCLKGGPGHKLRPGVSPWKYTCCGSWKSLDQLSRFGAGGVEIPTI
jgi:hypothetical protein